MRLDALDIARFAAFVGMVLVNFRIAANVTPDGTISMYFINMFEGRAAALFVLLAGIGFSLGTFDATANYKRVIFLFIAGMVNMTIFEADILHFYALYFLIAGVAIRFQVRDLILLGIGAILLWICLLVYFDYETGWNWDTLTYTDFWSVSGFIRNSFFNGWYPVFPWITFFLFGMAIGRFDLTKRSTHRRLLIGGFLGSMLVRALSGMASAADPGLAEFSALSPIPPGPFYILYASCVAAATVGGILMITPFLTKLRITALLAPAGRQALTLYIAHILIGMGVMEYLGLLDGRLSNPQILAIACAFCLGTILYAYVWKFIAKHGPLEWCLRFFMRTKFSTANRSPD